MPDPKLLTLENDEYVHWIRTLPCLLCHGMESDPHHVRHARKNDYMAVPLCREHHGSIHNMGGDTFAETYSIDLSWEIMTLLMRYIELCKGHVIQ